MTTRARRRPEDHGADPWWGIDDHEPANVASNPGTLRRARRSGTVSSHSRRRQRGMSRLGWLLLGLLVAPIDLLRRMLARSPRLRRLAARLVVVLAVVMVLACSVGVILINNVVIGRTAELGELDDRRRELRRDNALLGAKSARLSSPDVVFRRATKELGMVRTDDVPQFIYVVPESHTLTPWQRQKRTANLRAAHEAKAAAAAAAAKPDANSGTAPANQGER